MARLLLAALALLFLVLPVTAFAYHDLQQQVAALINRERAERGLLPVTFNRRLSAAAHVQCSDMAAGDFLGHTGSDGANAQQRIERQGYDWQAYGEILGREYEGNAREMVDTWLRSPRHAEVMLSPDYTEFGVSVIHKGVRRATWYWAAVFGKPLDRKMRTAGSTAAQRKKQLE